MSWTYHVIELVIAQTYKENSMNLPFVPKQDASSMELTCPPSRPASRHAKRKQRNVNSLMNLGENQVYIIKKGTAWTCMNLPFVPKHDASLMEPTNPWPYPTAQHANREQRNVNALMNLWQNHFHIIKTISMNLPLAPTQDAPSIKPINPPLLPA